MSKPPPPPPPPTEVIRKTIKARGLTAYRLGKTTGTDSSVIQRFIDGGDVRGLTLDKLAAALGLGLVERDHAAPAERGAK